MILKYSPIVILIVYPFHDLNVFPAEEPQIMVLKHPLLTTLIVLQQKNLVFCLSIKTVWMYVEFIIPEM